MLPVVYAFLLTFHGGTLLLPMNWCCWGAQASATGQLKPSQSFTLVGGFVDRPSLVVLPRLGRTTASNYDRPLMAAGFANPV